MVKKRITLTKKIDAKESIETIMFVHSLNLDWEERLSLEYSNGLSTYWEVYHSYQRQMAFRAVIDTLPVMAVAVTAGAIIGLIENMRE